MNKTPLCYAPFTNMFVSSKNRYGFCCSAKRVTANSPEQFWTSEFAVQTRKKMLEGQFPDECVSCENRYNQGLRSDRDDWIDFNKINLTDKKTIKQSKQQPVEISLDMGNATGGPIFLDYRPSNKCNLKCRMCSAHASNLIEKEIVENTELQQWMELPSNNIDRHVFYNYIKDKQIRHVKLLGGEPTIEPLSIEFMNQLLISEVKPSIHITTNCTSLNDKFYRTLRKFNGVHISISIDGTGKVFEYIRTNSSWRIVKKNIEHILREKYADTYIFNVVLTPYNIFNLGELLIWLSQLKQSYNFSISFLDYADTEFNKKIQDLSCVLPQHIEDTLVEIYKIAKMFKYDKQIINLIKVLENTNFNYENYQKFVKFNNLLDKIRKTNLVDLDPRFTDYV